MMPGTPRLMASVSRGSTPSTATVSATSDCVAARRSAPDAARLIGCVAVYLVVPVMSATMAVRRFTPTSTPTTNPASGRSW
jgi:hypothetical protein